MRAGSRAFPALVGAGLAVSTPANAIATVWRRLNLLCSPSTGAGMLQTRSQLESSRKVMPATARGQPMLLAQPAGAFDRRMRQIARGMVFEEVGEQVQPGFGCGEGGFGREIRAVRQRETLDAFDDVGAARKSACGEARRQQPVLCRLPGVERLAHRPELRFEPGRLCPGDAERHGSRLGIETEQPSAGRRSAEGADRAGRMKTEIVMSWLQCRADPARGLVASDKGDDHLAPRAAPQFGQGEQAGQDRHRGMPRHRHIDVVIIERVARCAVDERRRQRRQSGLTADDARLWRAAGLGQLVEQKPHQLVARPGDRHAEIVENALPGELTRVPR